MRCRRSHASIEVPPIVHVQIGRLGGLGDIGILIFPCLVAIRKRYRLLGDDVDIFCDLVVETGCHFKPFPIAQDIFHCL